MECSETNEKNYFPFLQFLFYEKWLILNSKFSKNWPQFDNIICSFINLTKYLVLLRFRSWLIQNALQKMLRKKKYLKKMLFLKILNIYFSSKSKQKIELGKKVINILYIKWALPPLNPPVFRGLPPHQSTGGLASRSRTLFDWITLANWLSGITG